VSNAPAHVISIIAKERWSISENVYYTAYRAVCTCSWKGAHHCVDDKDPKRARHYAEKDGERHYDLHRNYAQLAQAESTDD
jgi:hypothetical protein